MKPAYETYDLVLAAFLLASDSAHLIDIISLDGRRRQFRFDPPPSKEQLIQFYSGEAQVSARKFAEAFATLKGTAFTLRDF